eukprot:2202916-Amphidinium_carterae.1
MGKPFIHVSMRGLLTISVQRSADPAIALACTMAIVLLAPLNLWKQGDPAETNHTTSTLRNGTNR